MNVDQLQLVFDVFQFVCLAAIGLYTRNVNRTRAQRAEVTALAQRVTILEQDVRHMPSHNDLNGISSRIEELNKSVAQMSGGLEGLRRAVDLMNEHLLNRGGRG